MWIFIGLMLTVYFMVSVFLIFVILIQSGKGGGLSSLGSSSQGISDALGSSSAERTLNKMTTWCAVAFMVLAIMLFVAGNHATKKSSIRGLKAKAEAEAPNGATPAGAPGAPPTAPVAPGKPVTMPPRSGAKPGARPGAPIRTQTIPAAPAASVPAAPAPAAPVPAAPAPASK